MAGNVPRLGELQYFKYNGRRVDAGTKIQPIEFLHGL